MVQRFVKASIGGSFKIASIDVQSTGRTWVTKAETGPATGTTFTNYTGSTQVPAGIYRKVRFTSRVEVLSTAAYIFEDCSFEGGWTLFRGTNNVQATRCNFVGGFSLSSVQGATFTRCRVTGKGGGDLTHITGDSGRQCANIKMIECWVGDAVLSANDHLDGLQVRGCNGLLLQNCTFDVGVWRTTTNGGLNAAVFCENANGGNSNITIEGCYLNGGGYVLRIGRGGHQNTRVRNNQFGPNGNWGEILLTAVTLTELTNNTLLANGQPARVTRES